MPMRTPVLASRERSPGMQVNDAPVHSGPAARGSLTRTGSVHPAAASERADASAAAAAQRTDASTLAARRACPGQWPLAITCTLSARIRAAAGVSAPARLCATAGVWPPTGVRAAAGIWAPTGIGTSAVEWTAAGVSAAAGVWWLSAGASRDEACCRGSPDGSAPEVVCARANRRRAAGVHRGDTAAPARRVRRSEGVVRGGRRVHAGAFEPSCRRRALGGDQLLHQLAQRCCRLARRAGLLRRGRDTGSLRRARSR